MSDEVGKRIDWIDTAKAVAIILVGVGHYCCPGKLLIWIYCFHMPLFFILSGFTLNIYKYQFAEFVKRKVKTLLIPWFVVLILYIIFQNLCLLIGISAREISFNSIISRIIFNIRLGDYDPIYWFIPAIFITEIILYFLFRVCDNKVKLIAGIVVFGILAYLYSTYVRDILPWEVDILPINCFFVSVGYFIKTYYMDFFDRIKGIRNALLGAILILIGGIIGFANYYITGEIVDFSSGTFGNVGLCMLAGVLTSIGIICFCKLIRIRVIRFIGKNSLYYYLLQPFGYKITDILLCLCLPFYSYGGNMIDLILLHVGANIAIGIVVILYLVARNKLMDRIQT